MEKTQDAKRKTQEKIGHGKLHSIVISIDLFKQTELSIGCCRPMFSSWDFKDKSRFVLLYTDSYPGHLYLLTALQLG